MNLFIFSSSTGMVGFGGTSYIDKLETVYSPQGLWNNGFSILSARHNVHRILKGNKRVVILHLGAVECFTMPAENFLVWCIRELGHHWYTDSDWKAYFYHKLLKATDALFKKETVYIRPLEDYEFRVLYEELIRMLEGSKILIMGMSKPVLPEPHWTEQAVSFNNILKELSDKYNTYFIDVYNKYSDYVVDSNHLNTAGHELLYQEVDQIIRSAWQ
jgi:hypothetical protein